LDLATGTGIVAHLLAKEVGDSGSIVGMDMNEEMLDIAASRADSQPNLSFAACRAEELDCPNGSFDYVICQQGFQFFSDRSAAAKEIFRVLRDGGTAIVSVWRPISECPFFDAVREALKSVDEDEIAEMIRVPFDFMPRPELVAAFESAGFSAVEVRREQRDLVMAGGTEHAIQATYSTPIGPRLRELTTAAQTRFVEALAEGLQDLDGDGGTMGQMASDVLVATK
jgi:ubiquinone/menaquinone biosynthesis C-methylase UbiE